MNPSTLRKKLAESYYGLQNAAFDRGFFNPQKRYTKFVIIGRSRVGSTLIRTALDSHPNVRIYGEVFRIPGQVVWDPKYGRKPKDAKEVIASDPSQFLRSKVFRTYPANIKAVGFKIFYYHAKSGSWNDIWQYLVSNEDIRIIHNKRRNILESQLSKESAKKTGRWAERGNSILKSSNYHTAPMVHLDFEELKNWFILTKEWENHIDRSFAGHKKIDVFYEDLSDDYVAELGRIQSFLGLERVRIEPRTKKQARGSLSHQIDNYWELKSKFHGTPWIEFFED